MVSNVSGRAYSPYTATLSSPLNHLFEGKENIFLSVMALKEYWKLTKFTQIRWKCYKENVGRVIDIATSATDNGKNALNFFLGNTNTRPNVTQGSFVKLPDDTSMISVAPVSQWGTDGKWSISGVQNDKRLWYFPIYIQSKYHYIVYPGRWECDDHVVSGSPAVGSNDYWQLYVR